MSIWETLGELIGRAFKSVTDTILGMLSFKASQLEDINTEIAGASLDPTKFKTTEVKALAQKIKDNLKHSPEGVADWAQGILGDFMVNIWDVAIGIMIPTKMESFEDAKASAAWLGNLFADFVVLSAVLDMVGTALSATLVRNLIHIFRLFAATFGMDRYLDACIAPALSASIVPQLTYGYQKQYKPFRLDPGSIITAWRRDPAKYEALFNDLREQGWSEDRLEALKFATLFFPSAQDLVLWEAKEVFEPDMIAKFGLADEFEKLDLSLFAKAGISEEMARNFWIAHWIYPSMGQVFDMLHRDEIEWADVSEYMRLAEYPPFWREKLEKVSWDIPNRIEIRMMARYLDMPKEQIVDLLKKAGLAEEYRSDAADFMMIMGLTGYWSSMLSNGWMAKEQVKADIDSRNFNPKTAERIYKSIVKQAVPQQVEEEKKATATEIMKGVKTELITWDEGVEMLGDLNYSPDVAEFKLAVYLGLSSGSPESYTEFKQLSQMYRKATGLSANIPPPELTEAEKALKEAEAELKAKVAEGMKEEKLVPYQKAKDDAAYRYRQLLIQWKEAKKKK